MVDVPVKVIGHPFNVRAGRLANLSVSGGFIEADFELRLLSRIEVALEVPRRSKHEAESIAAYVARKYKDGIGVEWCEFAPPAVTGLLQTFSARRYTRERKSEAPVAVGNSRLSAPLLKHGS